MGFVNEKYGYYPLVITAISFTCGLVYLVMILLNAKKKVEVTPENKNTMLVATMGGNFVRFAIMAIGVLCCFLFVHFTPVKGEIDRWVYALILIAGLPMIIDIALFYLRSAYVE